LHYNVQFLSIVKTNHARFPKDFIETSMKTWPAAHTSYSLLVEGSASEGVDLLAVG